jgi:hypothetical protein
MKKHYIKISQGQYLSDLEPFRSAGIPSNCMVHKKLPGCGMTTFEIRFAKHHSIIILPNVPVIQSKVDEHNKLYPNQSILGVYKGIEVDDIKAYLLSNFTYKKILTTPEGFVKVKLAFENESAMTEHFFLLFDECERIITDISYRGKIAAPLETFFGFKNKALVSATTLEFSDERFKNFDHYIIQPDYDYSQPLTVINSNNVVSSLKKHLDALQSENVCIFLNSTTGIYAVVDTLNIAEKSRAYCAKDSVVKLMTKRYMNALSDFEAKDMKPYSLFTSRYFSAFDIKLDYQPDVIMISDIAFASHSILDPHTEVIQIAGRFRNGVNSLTHITNYKPEMEVKTRSEALNYLEGCLDSHESVVGLFRHATHPGWIDTLHYFLENSPVAGFYENGKRNQFMIDNDIYNERVKGYYKSADRLRAAYDDVKDHFATVFIDEEYNISDSDLVKLSKKLSKKEKMKQVAIMLDSYTATKDGLILLSENSKEVKNYLTKKYPDLAEAHRLLGSSQKVDAIGYSTKALKKAIVAANKANQIAMIAKYVHYDFEENNDFVYELEVKVKLKLIYARYHIKFKVSANHILRYFTGRRTQRLVENGYVLKDRLDYETIRNNFLP